jgi:hypothetical protein
MARATSGCAGSSVAPTPSAARRSGCIADYDARYESPPQSGDLAASIGPGAAGGSGAAIETVTSAPFLSFRLSSGMSAFRIEIALSCVFEGVAEPWTAPAVDLARPAAAAGAPPLPSSGAP